MTGNTILDSFAEKSYAFAQDAEDALTLQENLRAEHEAVRDDARRMVSEWAELATSEQNEDSEYDSDDPTSVHFEVSLHDYAAERSVDAVVEREPVISQLFARVGLHVGAPRSDVNASEADEIGDITDPTVLDRLRATVRFYLRAVAPDGTVLAQPDVNEFVGQQIYHVPAPAELDFSPSDRQREIVEHDTASVESGRSTFDQTMPLITAALAKRIAARNALKEQEVSTVEVESTDGDGDAALVRHEVEEREPVAA